MLQPLPDVDGFETIQNVGCNPIILVVLNLSNSDRRNWQGFFGRKSWDTLWQSNNGWLEIVPFRREFPAKLSLMTPEGTWALQKNNRCFFMVSDEFGTFSDLGSDLGSAAAASWFSRVSFETIPASTSFVGISEID